MASQFHRNKPYSIILHGCQRSKYPKWVQHLLFLFLFCQITLYPQVIPSCLHDRVLGSGFLLDYNRLTFDVSPYLLSKYPSSSTYIEYSNILVHHFRCYGLCKTTVTDFVESDWKLDKDKINQDRCKAIAFRSFSYTRNRKTTYTVRSCEIVSWRRKRSKTIWFWSLNTSGCV